MIQKTIRHAANMIQKTIRQAANTAGIDIFTNSDVTVFFLELMPRLRPGVIIHVHDIFLPWDYLPEWNKRMYSEQYILAAMMLCPRPLFKVLMPNWFACDDPELSVHVKSLLEPFGCIAKGGSFWMEKV